MVQLETTVVSSSVIPERVTVHPLVLLSVVDHYNRVAKNTRKRVVGVLLGQNNGKYINVANSFAGI
jgi:26S proteasome regulatory subunit N8